MYFNKLLQTDFVSRKQKRIAGLDSKVRERADNLKSRIPSFSAPLVSVVLPVFNHAKFISGAISSVLSQTLPLELIIVDDGSTDELESVISKFLKDKRVQFFKKENGGLASALNLGFEHASAPFFTWTSADNIYLPDSLSELVGTLIENPAASLAYGNVELIDERGKLIQNSNYRPSDQFGTGLTLTREGSTLFEYDDNFINSCFLYRRSFANLAGQYSSILNGVEDYEYWLKLSAFSPALHVCNSRALYQYRLHSNSLTSALDADDLAKLTREVRISVKKLREEIDSRSLPSNLKSTVENTLQKLPLQIVRSRDSDFKSIPEISGEINVGIFYRTGEMVRLEKPSGINVSIYTLDKPESDRDFQIKGISLFNDHPEETSDLTIEEYRARSLMFFLSRVDYLLLPTNNWSAEELRFKAGLAASAGVELRTLKKNELSKEEAEFLDLFLPAKHITFHDSLAAALSDELKFTLGREYFDKWLYSQSFNGISALVKTGMLAKNL